MLQLDNADFTSMWSELVLKEALHQGRSKAPSHTIPKQPHRLHAANSPDNLSRQTAMGSISPNQCFFARRQVFGAGLLLRKPCSCLLCNEILGVLCIHKKMPIFVHSRCSTLKQILSLHVDLQKPLTPATRKRHCSVQIARNHSFSDFHRILHSHPDSSLVSCPSSTAAMRPIASVLRYHQNHG